MPVTPAPLIDDVNVSSMVAFVLRSRRVIARAAGICFSLVVAAGLLSTRTYTTTTTFYPQGNNQAGGLLGLAAQVGFSVANQSQAESPDFYVTLATSDRILRWTVDTVYSYHLGDSLRSTDLVAYYEIDRPDRQTAVRLAMDRLAGDLSASADVRTGLVRLSVRTKSSDLSAAVSARILGLLNQYDAATRQTQAGQERRFLEGRMTEVEGLLRQAENRMQSFLERNRDFRNSPQLTFQQTRLQREIDMQQGVFVTLAQGYERARMDEVRNLPILTLVEQPIPPPVPDRRRLAFKGLLALLVGAFFGVVVVILRNAVVSPEGGSGDPDLPALWDETLADLRRPWRFVW